MNLDLGVLAKRGFEPEDHAHIIGILDTFQLSRDVLKGVNAEIWHSISNDFRFKLMYVLKELGFVGRHFHNGGNDTNFTVRALLLLVERQLQNNPSQWTKQTPLRLEMLRRSIAMDPLPPYCCRLENKDEEIAALNRTQRHARRPSIEWDTVSF
jgi:hypothetical protein